MLGVKKVSAFCLDRPEPRNKWREMLAGHWPARGQGQWWSHYRFMGQEKVQCPHHGFSAGTAALPTQYIIGHFIFYGVTMHIAVLTHGFDDCAAGNKTCSFLTALISKKASHWPTATHFLLPCDVPCWAEISVLMGMFGVGAQTRSPAQVSKAGSGWSFPGSVDQRDWTDELFVSGKWHQFIKLLLFSS